MEVLLKRPLQAVKEEEKKVDLKGEEGEALKQKQIGELLGTASSSTISDLDSKDTTNTKNKEELLESARAEVSGLRQENERLKTLLSRIMKDYESLKNQFITISQRQGQETNNHQSTDHNMAIAVVEEDHEGELLSLSLGTAKSRSTTHGSKDSEKKADHMDSGDLSLTLAQCSSKAEAGSASTDDPSSDEVLQKDEEEEEEEEGGGEPGKVLGKNCKNNDSELSQLVQVKKARVSVRARCDAPTMNDGCQWRKYGQKISKGNPCPRAYYRCTVAPACPVRKQVQRCAEDMSVLITTYEGTHNHPLPLAATSIASTTSAAASMLLSSSSASTQSLATASLSFGLSQASRPPPSSFHHLSASPSHPPTITLDLTSPTPQFNTSSLGFSPYPSLASGYFNKYNNQLSNNSNSSSTSNLYSNRNPSFSSYLSRTPSGSQEVLTETLARAITADPSFKSALAEALTSIVGGESSGQALAANPTSMSSAANNHLSKPSPAVVGERFGYLQSSSSSLGFLTSKGSSSMENIYRD